MSECDREKIVGYAKQSDMALEAINGLKIIEIETLNGFEAWFHPEQKFDARWKSIARTHIQQGFMAAVRAIARPHGD